MPNSSMLVVLMWLVKPPNFKHVSGPIQVHLVSKVLTSMGLLTFFKLAISLNNLMNWNLPYEPLAGGISELSLL